MKLGGIPIEDFAVKRTGEGESLLVAERELTRYIRKDCGADLSGGNKKHFIVLGANVKTAEDDIKSIEGYDGFVIKLYGGDLVVTARTESAVLYGTYYFIEKYLGVEWLALDCEISVKDVSAEDLTPNEVFGFTAFMRVCHNHFAYDEVYRARHRLTFTVGDINDKIAYGGLKGLKFAFYWGYFGHTFEVLLPYEKYYAKHPDWYSFSDKYYGENHRYQICLTNPDVLKTVTENALSYLDAHPDCKIISVSQNDSYGEFYHNYCKCENCRRVWETDGNYSAVLLNFVNAVAREIGKKYPDVLVHTFAYNFTETPPNTVKPEKNVLVQFCTQMNYGSYLTDGGEDGAKELEKAEKWRKLTDNLFAWTYICNHSDYVAPIGNFRALYENTVYFLRGRVKGLFQQERMDYYCCEFSELRAYLTAKLFTNPYADYEAYRGYIKTFARGFYGKGGGYIVDYLDLLDEKFAGINVHKMSDDEKLEFYGDADFIAKGNKLYAEALRLAETDEQKLRVEKSRMQLKFCETAAAYLSRDKSYPAMRRAFVEKLLSYGVKNYKEGAVIPPIEKLDCEKSPFVYAKKDKTIILKDGDGSVKGRADESTAEVYGFDFDFDVSYAGGVLKIKVDVADGEIFCNDNNINSWEQDCVEIYVSETCNRTWSLAEGDYRVRINAHGIYECFGNESKVKACGAELAENGYSVFAELYVGKADTIGFEVVAHDFGADGKYKSTRYWNALKFADVFSAPYHYGIIKTEEVVL